MRVLACPLLYSLVRLTLAVAFVWAGVVKLADPSALAVTIQAFGLVPNAWVAPLSRLLPLLEVVAGLGLALDLRGSLAVIALLLLLFLAVLGYGLVLGLDIDCGCYSTGSAESRAFSGLRPAFFRDLWFLAGAAYCYLWRGLRRRFLHPSSRSMPCAPSA